MNFDRIQWIIVMVLLTFINFTYFIEFGLTEMIRIILLEIACIAFGSGIGILEANKIT